MGKQTLPDGVDFWVQRIHLRRRTLISGVILRALGGAIGALVTPLIAFAVAIGFGYLLVIFLIASTTSSQRTVMTLVALFILYAVYGALVAWAFRSEYQTGLFLYEGAQHRPPADIILHPQSAPFFYAPIGLDLMHDDAPVNIIMKLPTFWARIFARAAIQWRIYRSVKHYDAFPAARILAELARRGEGIKTEELLSDGAALDTLHQPLAYLIVLDMIGIAPAWSKIWLSPDIRRAIERK
jgi:hypothetical protein